MNLTHTVGDIRNFINACVFCSLVYLHAWEADDCARCCRARPENSVRPYTIGTTFPNRILEDGTQSVEQAGLKNAVVVQRWT